MSRFELLQQLRASFSDGEMRDICLELNLDYEELAGHSKADKARELVLHLERRKQLPSLLSICQRLRPEHAWLADAPALPTAPTQTTPPLQPKQDQAVTILFLAANPVTTEWLQLDEEIRAIDQALLRAGFRQHFNIEQQWALRPTDLQECLLRFQPAIVHFSGHGSDAGEIILQDEVSQPQPVSPQGLGRLFALLKANIRCVVLNACFSELQGRAIAEHIECVVGMSKAIGDASAIQFATAFYQALGYGKDVQSAFDLGCLQIDLARLGEQDTPRLLATRSDPTTLVFAAQSP